MNNENKNSAQNFKYKMSFYYQSTIIYFVVFIMYAIIRGEFVENSFKLITKDPIIYFFGLIVVISLISLVYNIYKNKHLVIREDNISFVNRFRERAFTFDKIIRIRISRENSERGKGAFKIVRIKLKNRRRPLVIRPYDYENGNELLKKFQEIKSGLEKK
ncbi:MAG TPA: hypothetical protein VJ954_01745 [Ignavibacteriaceae bacterium]|nr:hypothetical protein [Ignavibacteriaceae bacterium]